MSNKKINFKSLNNSNKVKLINNSLVLEELTLKELSKKINIQKKDIILFMKSEGFIFDEIDGYFKKEVPIKSIEEESTVTSIEEKEIENKTPSSELEDVQSIIDSINQKLKLKEGEHKDVLLPEIKAQPKKYCIEDYANKTDSKIHEKNEILTLEIPKISRTERRKKLKKSPIKRLLIFLKSLFKMKKTKSTILPQYDKEEVLLTKDNNSNNKVLQEVATSTTKEDKVKVNFKPEIIPKNIENSFEPKIYFNIKFPNKIKILSKKYDKNKIYEKPLLNLDKLSIDYLKEEISTLKIDPAYIQNLKSDKTDNLSTKDLEIRVNNLEKKVSELEEFFVEIFEGMLIK